MFANAKRIVIKVGSSLIIGEDNLPRKEWLYSLAADIAPLRRSKDIIVVSSGAVALGRENLGYDRRELALEEKQAAAACGQIKLFSLWDQVLHKEGQCAAQLLLTAEDLRDKVRYDNTKNTFETLLRVRGVVPVVNENDTVATAELRFGDNDKLAAQVAQMAGADLLILFSDVDGLYSENPNTNPHAEFISEVHEITPEIEAMAGGARSAMSSGGMTSKIAAAKIATGAGCQMIIMNGHADHPVNRLKDGEKHTAFQAAGALGNSLVK